MPVVVRNVGELFRRLHLRLDRFRLGRHLSHVAHDQFLEPGVFQQLRHLRIEAYEIERHQKVCFAVLDLVLQHLLRIERRIIDDRPACFQDSEQADEVVRRVGQIQTDVNAGLHAEFLKAMGRAVRKIIELAIGNLPAHEIDRRMIREIRRGFFKKLLHRDKRDIGIPLHSGRIGFDPRHVVHCSRSTGRKK